MKFAITNSLTGAVQFEADIIGSSSTAVSIKRGLAVKWAVKNGADLRGVFLADAFLGGADLSGVDLSGSDLSRADLSGADLSRANLSGADLTRAFLKGANLDGTSLINADLRGAYLNDVDLNSANMSGAQMEGAWRDTNKYVQPYYITFGTNSPFAKHYLVVYAANITQARDVAIEQFGTNWSMAYDEKGFAHQPKKYGLKRLAVLRENAHGHHRIVEE